MIVSTLNKDSIYYTGKIGVPPRFDIRTCEECDSHYVWKHHDGGSQPKYCGDECQRIGHQRNTNAIAQTKKAPVYECICETCGKSFIRKKHCGNMPKYCSRTCTTVAAREQKNALKNIPKNCEVCGTEFFTDKWKFKIRKYCSRACFNVAKATNLPTIEVPCSVCGKLVKRESRRRTKEQKNFYCGHECMAKARILDAPRTNEWANVRAWFSRFNRMSECVRCGYNAEPKILVVHHKDRDRTNNALSNLEVLCPNCHSLEHMAERATKWKGHVSTEKRKKKPREKNA